MVVSIGSEQTGEIAAELLGDVEQGSQGARREQGLATAPVNRRVHREFGDKSLDQPGLADPRLTGNQHRPPAIAYREISRKSQLLHGCLPFQEHG